MSTTLANCRILLSKQLGDYWASATTTTADPATTVLIDTDLKAKADDWIPDDAYDLITESGHTNEHEERKILKLDNDSGLLTVLAHSATIDASVGYEIHRLFTASEKRRALIHAAKAGFPFIFKEIRDQSLTAPASTTDRIDISSLGLAQNKPHQVWQKPTADILEEPWIFLRHWYVGSDGYLYCRTWTEDYTLRIIGIGYLDFVDDDGVVGTDWDDDSIDIDSPQTEILVAEAAIYLCNQKVIPTDVSGESDKWERALAYWKRELRDRQAKFGMAAPSATIKWGV